MRHIDIKERRYTRDHEWIDFYESYAITGISPFKLKGIRHLDKVIPLHPGGSFVREGQILAILINRDYQITIHMPVDGYVLKINEGLTGPEILASPDKDGWIAILTPLDREHRSRLMPKDDYERKYKVDSL